MKINLKKFTGFLFFGFLVMPFISFGSTGNETKAKRDTVSALVMYGNQGVFKQFSAYSVTELKDYRDSITALQAFDPYLVEQVNLLLSVSKMNKFQVSDLIDSLFEQPLIPYALINQINWFVDKNPPKEIDESIILPKYLVNIDESKFPADAFYHSWNTENPNPYPTSLTNNDTSLKLYLEGLLPNDDFVFPLDKMVLTSSYGWREGRMHSGVDLDLEVWDEVKSIFPGVVRVARFYGGYGRVVVVRHYNGLETLYAHLHRIKVVPGQKIEAGQIVGLGGSSGRSSGSHLHFEMRFKGAALNPSHIIDFKNQQLISQAITIFKTNNGLTALPDGVNVHEVKRGDNLFEIANRYGTTIKKLCELNNIKRNNVLYVGQKIRII